MVETVIEVGCGGMRGVQVEQHRAGGVGKWSLEWGSLQGRAGMTGLPCQAPACNPRYRSAGHV